MNLLQQRIARLRSDDDGSALAIALVFLMLFGGYVGTVLHLATAGQRATLAIRDEAVDTYAGGGALDGAINAVGPAPTTGVDPGTTPIPASTCFTLPTGTMDNTTQVTVTCQPRSGSGVRPQASANQPVQAVLAMSANASEGVALTGSANVTVQGAVAANKRIVAPVGARLASTGVISATDCTLAAGTSPACTTAAAPAPPLLPEPAAYPGVVTSLPSCPPSGSPPLVRLVPGTYLSLVALQAVFDCTSTVVWFTPGRYYFDFRESPSTHELVIGSGDVVVGGAAAGWTPGTTAAASVPYPTAASPTVSACDTTLPGVELVFGGDSRLNVTSGRAQFCAHDVSTTNQRVVIGGRSTTTPALPASAASSGRATLAANIGNGQTWTSPTSAAVVDDVSATRLLDPRKSSVPLRIGPMTSPLVPPEATGITLTIKVTETLAGAASTTLVLRPGDGSASLLPRSLRDCAVSACNDRAFVSGRTDTVTVTGLTAAQVNGLSVDLTLTAADSGQAYAWVDGVQVSADFSAPMRATSGTGVAAPYVSSSDTTTPLLKVSGSASTTVFALRGTAYAPSAVVDVAVTGVAHPLVDRGMIVRHLQLSSTPAAGYTGPLVSVPELPLSPRQVLFVARDGAGVVLATADVIFADAAGSLNGTVARVQEWYIG